MTVCGDLQRGSQKSRMDARGTVIAALDEPDLRAQLRELVSNAQIETLCAFAATPTTRTMRSAASPSDATRNSCPSGGLSGQSVRAPAAVTIATNPFPLLSS